MGCGLVCLAVCPLLLPCFVPMPLPHSCPTPALPSLHRLYLVRAMNRTPADFYARSLYPARFQSIPSPPLSLFLPFLPLLQAFLILIAARGLLMTHLYHPCLYIASLFAQLDTVPGGDCKLAGIQSLFALNGHVRARF